MALSIIGAGVGRTGTASLKVALERLGTGKSYHMSDVLQDPERVKTWLGVAGGDADWDKIFDGYGSSVTTATSMSRGSGWSDVVKRTLIASLLRILSQAGRP